MQLSYKTELLKKEIAKVNETIDRKIVRGAAYARESAYHKMLLKELRESTRSHFLARSLRMVSTFLF